MQAATGVKVGAARGTAVPTDPGTDSRRPAVPANLTECLDYVRGTLLEVGDREVGRRVRGRGIGLDHLVGEKEKDPGHQLEIKDRNPGRQTEEKGQNPGHLVVEKEIDLGLQIKI